MFLICTNHISYYLEITNHSHFPAPTVKSLRWMWSPGAVMPTMASIWARSSSANRPLWGPTRQDLVGEALKIIYNMLYCDIVSYYTILYNIVLYHTMLYCIILYYIVLYYIILLLYYYYIILYWIILYCIILYYIVSYYIISYYFIILYYIILYHYIVLYYIVV